MTISKFLRNSILEKKIWRVSTSKLIYFAAIVLFVILIVLILRNFETGNEVVIKKIKFSHGEEGVYVTFTINNPTDRQNTCLLTLNVAGKNYKKEINVTAKSKKLYKTPVDMPRGTTEVKLYYDCY